LSTTATESDLTVLGIPAHLTSLSPTRADATPQAVRQALLRFSTWAPEHNVDVADLVWRDAGDVDAPDGDVGEQRVAHSVHELLRTSRMLIAVGGDNSITHSVGRGLWQDPAQGGLITIDAHHDLRDGVSNGSPVRRLIDAGLPGTRVVQIGIADFSNSARYAARARELGITVISRADVARRGVADVWQQAVEIVGAAPGGVYVDIDVDVVDRAAVPACPAAAPGGLSAWELRQLAFSAGSTPAVRVVDLTEIDATADAADERTIRLAALCVLEIGAGMLCREL